ncbi:GerMN domain-containing protein [Actinopolymorpha singaporensis]|uniref:Uncharacterized protein n=1 Tax=Actinopolymorpha singaporensis TaxID=117157 RepID=A0A1H1UZE8_9ACTN|nr:GerMN domain-containing protein [Actinopolymorpha singaporensis]SDS77914.1 hypothetical protein SAMN04489717_3840 [Actinopolymorpha singaporensis]
MVTPDLVLSSDTCGTASLPLNPFVSNRYHFGMLLGVADLDTEQGYHRGKTWLHNAWLHGPGAVWGLGVEVTPANNEIVVLPGLALDGNGRELRVADRLCLDLGRWYAERRPDDLEVTEQADGSVTFTAHVRLCAQQCLDRPVPSVSEPCEGSDLGTAYSRTVEQALPSLAAGPAPADPVVPYPRLRQLVGQQPVTDPAVQDAVAAIATATDRPAEILRSLRRLAALDTVDLVPEDGVGSLFPVTDGCLALAQIEVHLRPDGDRWVVVDDTAVDNSVRPAHVRTRTIQELLLTTPAEAPGVGPVPEPARLRAAELTADSLRVDFTQPLLPATVGPNAFTVTALGATGWDGVEVSDVLLDEAGTSVTLTLSSTPDVRPVRVVARGAGSTPLLGADGQPLSGNEADGRTVHAGEDGALLIDNSGPDPE